MSQTPFPPIPLGVTRELRAELLITTPLFMGDGDQETRSIRPTAIKGALRFWWRALNWSRHIHRANGHTSQALQTLHQEEADLFGAAAGQEQGRQARFSVRVEAPANPPERLTINNNDPLGYLLGQGLYHFRDGVLRKHLRAGTRFTLRLLAHPGKAGPTAEQWESLDETLLAFGLLGTLGARARKGLGSVSLQELTGSRHDVPRDAAEYATALRLLLAGLGPLTRLQPPFSAISHFTRLDQSASGGRDALALLRQLGEQLQLYRSYGRKGKVLDVKAEANFVADHDNALVATSGECPPAPPLRAVFGLPHNYFFSSTNAKVDITSETERRASPLFIHIHQCPDGTCVATQLLMRAQFLPTNQEKLNYKTKKNNTLSVPYGPRDTDWNVITRYLDRFKQRQTLWTPGASA